jgi:ATPase subunit of ABC transporter with duplicated ATPase domains
MAKAESIISFENVSFEHGANQPILDEVNFSVRRGMKVTLMGQNGAGKSTVFQLIAGGLKPESGKVNVVNGLTIALSCQVIPREQLTLTVREFFAKCFATKIYDLDPRIDAVLEVVNLKEHKKVHDRVMKSFSGGEQGRLLLASALIQDPDLLLLDEPTNNLDRAGILHLTKFLIDYPKTVMVISHDADFLNKFTDSVLYLDIYTRKIEPYAGNYFDVVTQIAARVAKENSQNARLAKEAIAKKEKANFFAMKGGRLRLLAKRMRADAAEMEESQVDVRREDKTIRPFTIPVQDDLVGEVINISGVSLRRGQHLLLAGPNGIGKSTLLEAVVRGKAKGAMIATGVRVGYYRQDFSTLNFDDTVYESLMAVMADKSDQAMRSIAAGFLINGEVIKSKIGCLSEGQKGLVAFARLVLERPGLLILDEPTNHINFRHLPLIASALDKYQGAMILVSHVPEFVAQIRIDEILDLGKNF